MRIIAGKWKGRTIFAPKGEAVTRPTSDRAREALFNILMPRLNGSCVLDLFAGSGALGLEALSRGAASVTLVDRDRAACAAIRRNIEALGAQECARLLQGEALFMLGKLSGEKFDLVLIDPPYRAGLYGETAQALMKADLLAKGAMVVVESQAKEPPGCLEGLSIVDQRRYGIALMTFYTREGCE